MKKFDVKSFGLGLATGLLVLFIFAGAKYMLFSKHGGSMEKGGQMGTMDENRRGGFERGDRPEGARQGSGNRTERMAERLGVSAEELQAELDAGKTMQEIAEEKGIDMPAGRLGGPRPRSGTGAMQDVTATGSIENDNN